MSSSPEPLTASLTMATVTSSPVDLSSAQTLSSVPSPTTEPFPTVIEDQFESHQTYPPMTTHWSVPLSCTWTYNIDRQPQSGVTGAVAWLDLEPIINASTLSCYPDGMFYNGRTGIFSPGTCPNGWTTVSLMVNTNEVKDTATTTAVCCSSEYYLDGNHCKRSVPTVLAVPITYNHSAGTYEVMSSSTTTLYGATIAVYTIRALFQESDKKMLNLQDEDDIDDEDPPPHSLSLNARIGIGVGVGIFILLAIGAIAYCLLRRDRARARRSHELSAIRHRERHGTDDNLEHRTHCRSSHDAIPPPAYEAATDSTSYTERGSGDSTTRDEEIRTLRVQKAVIQRRLEELEHVETNVSEDGRRSA